MQFIIYIIDNNKYVIDELDFIGTYKNAQKYANTMIHSLNGFGAQIYRVYHQNNFMLLKEIY